MKDVFTHVDSTQVGLCKSLLEGEGIGCFVRNETAAGIRGGPAIPAFCPTLCVVDDADYDRAKAILDEYLTPSSPGAGEWICPNCKSTVPAEFGSCWSCERERPSG